MESMTGYAFLEMSTDQFSYSVEIKSLNAKYLEVFVSLPKVLRNDENEYINIVKKFFNRGKIELNIDIFDWKNIKPIVLNKELIVKYYKELNTIHKSLKIAEPLKFESVLALEGVTQRERSSITAKAKKDILKTLGVVIKKTIEMRKDEGAVIKNDIQRSLEQVAKDANKIKALSGAMLKEKKDNLKKRLASVTEGMVDNSRIYSEISMLVDKLDINEELVRLNDHLKKFKSLMNEKGQMGRKLDFLSQELFREINTIASKSNCSEISHLAVNVKNHIDKVREHCRNVV
ncbi:MAG: YicC/YloC family endoribonuclease [Spirochaetota bacterium]